jgi:hypothetical protein
VKLKKPKGNPKPLSSEVGAEQTASQTGRTRFARGNPCQDLPLKIKKTKGSLFSRWNLVEEPPNHHLKKYRQFKALLPSVS